MTKYAAWYRTTVMSILLLTAVMVWFCPCAAGSDSCDFDNDEYC